MSSGSSARLIARMVVERRLAVLGRQIFHLALTDAVFAGAGAVHGERALDQTLEKILRALDLVGVVEVDQQQHMEIAVADMADDRREQPARRGVALISPTHSASREIGTHTSDDKRLSARAQPLRRPIGVVPRLPQPGAVLGARRPIERPAAELFGDLAEALRLLGDAGFGAVKLQKQHRRFRQREFRIEIAGAHLQRIEQFDARHRDAGLDGEDGGVARRLDRGERADARRDRLGNAGEPQRQFGDDAERAFRADHQPRQVVAGGGFLGAARRST